MLELFQAMLLKRQNTASGKQKVEVVSLVENQQDLVFMKQLIESGKVQPVIDGCYPLEKTAEAFRYYEQVHPKGKVVITIR
jgi:NADPH:quinone reductase-like Zn-dependent oxidoreductase